MRKKKIRIAVDRIVNMGLLLGIMIYAMLVGAQAYRSMLLIDGTIKPEVYWKKEVVIEPYISETKMAAVQEKLVEVMPDIEEEMYYDSLELLAICVEAEAGNQGLLGKRMVASVILNRVDDGDWPDTIEEVITQPYQFSSYWDGAMSRADPTEETFEACRMELEERGWPGLFYFTAGHYSEYGTPWKQVGDHYFSTK